MSFVLIIISYLFVSIFVSSIASLIIPFLHIAPAFFASPINHYISYHRWAALMGICLFWRPAIFSLFCYLLCLVYWLIIDCVCYVYVLWKIKLLLSPWINNNCNTNWKALVRVHISTKWFLQNNLPGTMRTKFKVCIFSHFGAVSMI